MKVAIIHEALNVYGGAEKVLEDLHAAFPQAPVFVPTYRPEAFPAEYREWDVRPTRMNRLPFVNRYPRSFFPIYPFAMQGIDVDEFDVVLSSSFNFAHNVVTGPDTCHICYCHSPARFLWDFNGYAEREGLSPTKRNLVTMFLPLLRANDKVAAAGVDYWVSTSRLVERRIRKVYRRRSRIIPPAIRVNDFEVSEKTDDYFLLVMRLVGWKRADIVIEACNAIGVPLVVAGEGRDAARLKALAGPNVRFVGRVDGEEKAALYSKCKALIVPSVEDFGITPLEAMASGRPVIALEDGGALDTVVPGKTGEFFAEQTVESLMATLRRFRPEKFNPIEIRQAALPYDSAEFARRIQQFAAYCHQRHQSRNLRPVRTEPAERQAGILAA